MILSAQQILEKIALHQVDYQDAEGNNLLHLLLMQEAHQHLSIDLVKDLLKQNPELVNQRNKKNLFPVQVLDAVQQESERISNRPVRRLLLKHMKPCAVRDQLERSVNISFWEQYACDKGKLRDNSRLLPVGTELFKKPSILFFSGWRTDQSRLLLGVARSFRKSLKLWRTPTPDLQMLFAQYPGNQQDLANDCEQVQHPKASLVSDHPMHYVRPFVVRYLRPLYAKNGKCLPLKQAVKNIRVVNLVGYSYGASVIQMIADAMKLDMKKLGFSEEEIRKIQSQIPAFLIAPYLNPKHSSNYFQSYYFANTQDKFIYNLIQSALDKKMGKKVPYLKTTLNGNKNQKIVLINDDCRSVITKLNSQSENMDEEVTPHDIRCYFQTENPVFRKINAWKNKIVFNMFRNTQQNQATKRLIPLGNLETRSFRKSR